MQNDAETRALFDATMPEARTLDPTIKRKHNAANTLTTGSCYEISCVRASAEQRAERYQSNALAANEQRLLFELAHFRRALAECSLPALDHGDWQERAQFEAYLFEIQHLDTLLYSLTSRTRARLHVLLREAQSDMTAARERAK